MSFRLSVFIIWMSLLLSGCQTGNQVVFDPPWQYSNIRALDAADSPLPGADILAVYLRQTPSNEMTHDIQIRLDFLDLSYLPECDIYLALDTQTGGANQISASIPTEVEWDILLVISSTLQINTYNEKYSPVIANGVSVIRDPLQDTMIINISGNTFQHSFHQLKYQVITTLPHQAAITDVTESISSTDFPPKQAEAVMIFWNTFPAYTPAQALRRWDGAHTGPKGNRHGLFNLLSAAKQYSVPLFLLDIKSPMTLSALDYVSGTALIRELVEKNLLILADPQPVLSYSNPIILPDDILTQEISFIKSVERQYQLPSSHAIFSISAPFNNPNGINQYSTVFQIEYPKSTSTSPFPEFTLSTCAGQTVIPVTIFPSPHPFYDQTGPEGPSLSLRRALIHNAIQNTLKTSSNPIFMILGGELPNSSWGIPDEAQATMNYFNHHPWIHLAGQNDLLSSFKDNSSDCRPQEKSDDFIFNPQTIEAIKSSPQNTALEQAIQTMTLLTTPIFPDSALLYELRQNYVDHVDLLLEVARWIENHDEKSDCNTDIDNDGQLDCVLSSDRFFLVIDKKNGGLRYAYFISNGNLHQIIAPSSLLATGLSSPDTWHGSGLEVSDPSVIPGAFWGKDENYHIMTSSNAIKLNASTGQKTYSLSSGGISIYITEPPINAYQIPFLFDPWIRFNPDWMSSSIFQVDRSCDNSYTWIYNDGSIAALEINQPINIHSFADSVEFMDETEHPDWDYPPGHFLPIPLIVVDLIDFSSPLIINLSVR
ncbi:MAG: hypothetical protein JW908_00050 [Anaerolineales bacterium]|nr:hypothetical protein [Anaerolineales bacterium]